MHKQTASDPYQKPSSIFCMHNWWKLRNGLKPPQRQGKAFLCKAVGELVAYWKASGISLDALEQALLEAEAKIDAEQQQQVQQQVASSSGDSCDRQQQQPSSSSTSAAEQQPPLQQISPSGRQQQQQQQQGEIQAEAAENVQQPQQQLPHRSRCPKRWVPTRFDSLSPNAKPLPTEGIGCNGADLFSAAHVMAHVRVAADLLHQLEESKQWKQVAFGALQLWHHHDKEKGLQHFRVHCIIEEPMLVGGGGGPGRE